MPACYIGLISGTSMDGIDGALVEFGEAAVNVLATLTRPYPDILRHALRRAVTTPVDQPIHDIGSLDRQVGAHFRDAAIELLEHGGATRGDVAAIGSHGQTLRHQPGAIRPYSLQIGNPDVIAGGTGITTVADFRSADIAAGGQGAPLVPPFHDWLFGRSGDCRVILNLGGIANVTILAPDGLPVTGFDTGPGNTLLDAWTRTHRNEAFDRDGGWAATGTCRQDLLARLLDHGYFRLEPPKSTGLEDFNLDWLYQHDVAGLDPADVQATLGELTATTVADAVRRHAAGVTAVYVCGGGAHNRDLLRRLARQLPEAAIGTTADAGLDPDWVEAVAFAWLAMRAVNGRTGNLPSVTGAGRKVILGTIHSP
ncbi:MAG: anhydro-N-acetylmuramic acid kinase [Proteobacteria bacterium]|nr:anhydro-N-acetylmuramic acid kinase [Pseudomonadota bacterium]